MKHCSALVCNGKAHVERHCLADVQGFLAVVVGLVVLAWGSPASAQGHEHGEAGPILLAHDGPADGRQFVGNLAHFSAISRGSDAIPDFHQDVPMRVTLNGKILFESTSDSGHDYDGINALDIVFPLPGPYTVEALDAAGNAVATFAGEVLPAPTLQVALATTEDMEILAGVPATYTVTVHEANGGPLVAHSDCWFDILQAGATLLRTKMHTHEEAQEAQVTFPSPGTYTVRFTCFQAFPSAKATLFQPTVVERSVGVGAGPPLPLPQAAPTVVPPPTALNMVVQGTAGGELLLVGTFDPATIVGPQTLQHLSVLAVDPATGVARQHVDFTAVLKSPSGGLLFSSDTLHEYDGIFEFATRQSVPGLYTLDVTADAGSWSDSVSLQWLVTPPVVPTSAGFVSYNFVRGGLNAGVTANYEFFAEAQSGPFAHSEVELAVVGDGPVPLLRTKLHTHDDGAFPFRLQLPEGSYKFHFDAFPLMPEAVVVAPVTYDVKVGTALTPSVADDGLPGRASPAVALPLLVMALGALAVARRWR